MTIEGRDGLPNDQHSSADNAALLSLIEVHWRDIHHSRNQDWKLWALLLAVGAGLISVGKDQGDDSPTVVGILLAAGAAISCLASLISWNHTELHLKKTAHIEWLESLLALRMGPLVSRGLPYSTRFKRTFPDRWFVSGIIFSVYATLALTFVTILLIVLGRDFRVIEFAVSPALAGLVTLALFGAVFLGIYFLFTNNMGSRRAAYSAHLPPGLPRPPSRPTVFVAETDALNHVAAKRGRGLVKLVAPGLRRNCEVEWLEPTWEGSPEGKLPVLAVEDNYFEVSLATPKAPQEWHMHTEVYEVYISGSAFDVETRQHDGSHGKTHAPAGCAIIPPRVWHRVRLGGPTFVVQATADGLTRVGESKWT